MLTYQFIGSPTLDSSGNPQVTISYLRDGAVIFTRVHVFFNALALKKQVQTILDNLANADQVLTDIGKGFDLVIPGPTPEEVAKDALNRKYAELAGAKQQLELKVIDQTAYDAKLAEFKAAEASAVAAVADPIP